LKVLLLALLLFVSAVSLSSAEADHAWFAQLTPVNRMPAYYPSTGRVANLEGDVDIMAYVDSSGVVYETRVVSSRQHPLLEKPAILAARLSRFEPAIRYGVAVPDSILLTYSFRKDVDDDSGHTTTTLPFRQITLDLEPNQVCLYGIWLSGEVQIRISEDRVYLDGIRVYPPIPHFDPDLNPEFSIKSVESAELLRECRYFERELATQDVGIDEIRSRTVDMVMGLRNVESAQVLGDHLLVGGCAGERLDLVLPDPRSATEYYSAQGRMADPGETLFGWVMKLHPFLYRFFIIYNGISSTMRLDHELAIALRSYLQQLGDEGRAIEIKEWPDELFELSRSLSDVVLQPLKVPRL